jgi:hypothetical protein
MDLETDPKLDSELDLDSWQSAMRIAKSLLWISKSALRIAFATGLPQFL